MPPPPALPSSPTTPHPRFARRPVWFGALLLVVLIVAAYRNSIGGPFVFDDQFAITSNPTVGRLWPLGAVLDPPSAHGETVGGRPLLNLSFALNYAIGGFDVRGYHVVNLLIHGAATLLVFGLVRSACLGKTGKPAGAVVTALVIAACWALHPLQTEAVTYVVQRAESLASLFLLATLYGVARAAAADERGARSSVRGWRIFAVGACTLGMATKEIVVGAPVLALLYDRAFIAGSFRAAWRARRGLYLALATTWALLGWLVLNTHSRGGSAGFGATGVSTLAYALTQPGAILHYLQLVVWPHPLVFDYGNAIAQPTVATLLAVVVIVLALVLTLFAMRRWPAAGFVEAWFFLLLAPSSSVVPIATQTMAEHRMYLALLAPIAAAFALLRRLIGPRWIAVAALSALAGGVLTAARNETYRSAASLWADTVAKRPDNARAQANLATVLCDAGKFPAAAPHAERAVRLAPQVAEYENTLANTLLGLGRQEEAVRHFETAVRHEPEYVEARYNEARALTQLGRWPEAVRQYQIVLQLRPDFVAAHNNLGRLLARANDSNGAEREYRTAIATDPEYTPAWTNLGNLLFRQQKPADAAVCYQRVLRLHPNDANAHLSLAQALVDLGRDAEALPHFEAAARLEPDDADTQRLLAAARQRANVDHPAQLP